MMMRGLGNSSRIVQSHSSHHSGGLPVPFNLPNVLHNLLFEEIELEFDSKQQDLIEALTFSYNALGKMQSKYALKDQELRAGMLEDPGNIELKKLYEEMQLDIMMANHQFKDLVTIVSDSLNRDQYQKLLKFSNINI